MILEIAEFHIRPDEQAAFEEAMGRALHTITAKAKGVSDYRLHRSIETPERYVLQVSWASMADHMIGYGRSQAHEDWRAIVRPFYAKPPTYQHFTLVTAA